jgi:hypothetical protein
MTSPIDTIQQTLDASKIELHKDSLLTVKEVAKWLRTTEDWVYRNRGYLGGVKLLGLIRFSHKFIEELLNAHTEEGPTWENALVRTSHGRRKGQNQSLQNQTGSNRLGGRTEKNVHLNKSELHRTSDDPFGLTDKLGDDVPERQRRPNIERELQRKEIGVSPTIRINKTRDTSIKRVKDNAA